MFVEAADRVLRILVAFPSDRDMSLTEVASAVELPKSTVHRLLAVLIGRGFVEQDPATRRYRLGIRLFEIGSVAIQARGLHAVAHDVLQDLTNRTSVTSHLAVLSENSAVYVDKVDGPGSILMSSRIGRRAPLHATSIGKVLAAAGGKEAENRLVRSSLKAWTANTITSAKALREELATVRARGYALDMEEYEEGLRCVAAPVRGQNGAVTAAIGVAASTRYLDGRRFDEIVTMVVDAAADLSRSLGAVDDGGYAPASRSGDKRRSRATLTA
jgi:IclR family transcriptional regulator, KDG regulon repressor